MYSDYMEYLWYIILIKLYFCWIMMKLEYESPDVGTKYGLKINEWKSRQSYYGEWLLFLV